MKQDVQLRRYAAIRDYIMECCLVGIYEGVDDDEWPQGSVSSLEANVTARDDSDLGYTEICAGLSARFGTLFGLKITCECTTLVAMFEGGIKATITDCGVTLTSVDWHLDGRAAGYYVGIHTAAMNLDSMDVDEFEQVGYACDPEAPPTVEAIGELVHQAVAYARWLSEQA